MKIEKADNGEFIVTLGFNDTRRVPDLNAVVGLLYKRFDKSKPQFTPQVPGEPINEMNIMNNEHLGGKNNIHINYVRMNDMGHKDPDGRQWGHKITFDTIYAIKAMKSVVDRLHEWMLEKEKQ